MYNTKTDHFRGVKKWFAFTMIRGEQDEVFYFYGYDEERSKILYSSFNYPLPNIFQGTAFKKHAKMLIKKKKKLKKNQTFFSSCHSLLTIKKKPIIFLVIVTSIQLIAHIMILLFIQIKIICFYHII